MEYGIGNTERDDYAGDPLDAIQQLELLVEKLGNLCEEIVVVGGCSPALILDIHTAPDLRPTDDVDVMVQADNYGRYFDFIERIKET